MQVLILIFLLSGTVFACGPSSPDLDDRPEAPVADSPEDTMTRIMVAGIPYTVKKAPLQNPVNERLICSGPRNRPCVALTFDACELAGQTAGYDNRVIDILLRTGTPATLFLGGKWMLSHEAETRYLASIPYFELANHSLTHPDLRALSRSGIEEQIATTQDIMCHLTGRQGGLFRAPFGWYDDRVIRIAARHGLSVVQWDVVSGDPDARVGPALLKYFVCSGVRNGSIVVMHMNRHGVHTHAALADIIHSLRQKGFRLVTVSELLAVTGGGGS